MYLGIDIGGSHVKYGLVSDHQVLFSAQFASKTMTLNDILGELEQRVHNGFADQGIALEALQGVAIALPGIVDSRKNALIAINKKLEEAVGYDFASWSADCFGVRAELFNDAKQALMGEAISGCAQGYQDISLVIIGTGIGTAVMMNGKVLHSRNHVAGNIGGHLIGHVGGRECTCGNQGCIEAYASNSILNEYLEERGVVLEGIEFDGPVDYKVIFDHYHSHPVCQQLGDELIAHWGSAVINMLHSYDSEVVVLSGGVFNSSVNILDKIQDYVSERVWLPKGSFKIMLAQKPSYSVMLGAESKTKNYFM
ncbi:putative ROK-family transcriptional regulator [Vibrio ishigakensis]|uniref:Putative ROK-family transcriptional regulator n=1 Tax=Vibrio ishigakensis TaxID=1481914 RepID=A0A0B8NVJ3_9VIBR|nr:ROK family protein [Vibrio ishigakensis]GAM55143.1 putative ROK-family transcriptional regulator [Vibrio ishigakensis]